MTPQTGSAGHECSVSKWLLFECDTRGNILWMSERARLLCGAAANLVDTIALDIDSSANIPGPVGVRLSRLWEKGGRVLVGALPPETSAEPQDLLRIQHRLLGQCERLEVAERRLSRGVRRRLRAGTAPIRQVELERQRLGRELHTGVGQVLAAIRLQLELLAIQLPGPVPGVQEVLDRIAMLSADGLEQVRTIARRVHPPEWRRLPIEEAIRQLWELSGIPQRFQSRLNIQPLPEQPRLDAKIVLYRAAQEAIANIIRHSRASQAAVFLGYDGANVSLRVEDNGLGFDAIDLVAGPVDLARGIGLRTIREQALMLGGVLHVESGSNGTILELSLPSHRKRTHAIGTAGPVSFG